MEIRAYPEDYLRLAQRILGDAFDFAVNTLQVDADAFMGAFVISGCAAQFERGNPSYVAGMTGCELAKEALDAVRFPYETKDDVMYLDKSPEYWAGWALAFYQWHTARHFSMIHKAVPVRDVLQLYPVYHEMDPMQFADEMNRRLSLFYKDTRLHARRVAAGYSQSALAKASGVSLRQIQQFEQRVRDINKTQALNLYRLGRTLGCSAEELLEL